MANEFVVKNGLIVSGSANVQNTVTAQSFTGSFSGSIAAPGSEGDIPRNVGGVLTADGDLQYEVTGGEAILYLGLGGGGASGVRLIGPAGPFLTADGPTGAFRFTQGLQYVELNDVDRTLRLAAGGSVVATVDSLSQGMGVGINAPTARLHVKGTGTTSSTKALRVENANSNAFFEARDNQSLALGNLNNLSTAPYSLGIGGFGLVAINGTGSVAIGASLQTDGLGNFLQGAVGYTSGSFSFGHGFGIQALADFSHAEGQQTKAIARYAHAEGGTTSAGVKAYDFARVGSDLYLDSSYGDKSAYFYDTLPIVVRQAPGSLGVDINFLIVSSSTFDGTFTIVTPYSAPTFSVGHLEIIGTATPDGANVILGDGSHAEGFFTVAAGPYSHAEGVGSIAEGSAAHAEGGSSYAVGNFSHAEGGSTIALANYSHTEGFGTVAAGEYQHVEGQYNISSSNASAFIIGNGQDDTTRSNLIYASGSEFQVTGSVNVTGSIYNNGVNIQSLSIAYAIALG